MRPDDFADLAIAAKHGMCNGMDASCRAVGRMIRKIKFEMSALLLDSLAQQAVYADHIFRDNSRLDGLRRYTDFSGTKPKQAVYLGRSIHEILNGGRPTPNCPCDSNSGLRPNRPRCGAAFWFGFLCNRNIRDRAEKLDAAGRILTARASERSCFTEPSGISNRYS